MTLGHFARAVAFPPPLPVPETAEDSFYISKLRSEISDLPLVKELRSHRDEWFEYEAYMTLDPEEASASLTAGALRGSRGLGVQRVFWNKKEKRAITVVSLGGASAGWPGVVHGGAIATVMQEGLERVGRGLEFENEGKEDVDVTLGDVKFTYKKPTPANSIMVLRAEVDEEAEMENGRIPVKASWEKATTGELCVLASGHCVRSTKIDGGLVDAEASSLWNSVWTAFGRPVS